MIDAKDREGARRGAWGGVGGRRRGVLIDYRSRFGSVAAHVAVLPGLAGASLCLPPGGASLSAAAGVVGASVGVSFGGAGPGASPGEGDALWPVWLVAPKLFARRYGGGDGRPQDETATEFGLWATLRGVSWRFGVPTWPMGPMAVPLSRRAGYCSWARLIWGKLQQRTTEKVHARTVEFAEGVHQLAVVRRTVRSWRGGRVTWAKVRRSVVVRCEHGVRIPVGPKGLGRLERTIYSFPAGHGDIDRAVREFSDFVTAQRREHGGSFWLPSLCLRLAPYAPVVARPRIDAGSFIGHLLSGGADPPAHLPVPWEVRDALTGRWSPWGTSPRADLPPDAIVEPRGIAHGTALAAAARGALDLIARLGAPSTGELDAR